MNNDRTAPTQTQPPHPASVWLFGPMVAYIKRTFPWWLVHACLVTVWLLIHLPAIYYGTDQLPFHSSFVGDEQSAVTGALQIVQTKNPLAIYDLPSLYYGPLFAVAAIPAVVGDYFLAGMEAGTLSAQWYKNYVLYDWGGIIWKVRIIALLVGYLGLVAVYRLLSTVTVNPQRSQLLPLIGTVFLVSNFYYFEYSGFFRHWVFIMVPLLWQLYFLIRMHEVPARTNRYFVYQALLAATAFGFSYLSLLSQILFVPLMVKYVRTLDVQLRNGFVIYGSVLLLVGGLLAAWHPYEVIRYLSIFTSDILRTSGANEYSISAGETAWSFGYYLQILFANHFFLLGALIILLLSIKHLPGILRSVITSCGLIATLYFLLIGFHSIHVSRYLLPVIIMLIVVVGLLLVRLYPVLARWQKLGLALLFGSYVIYHVVSIGFWLQMMQQGPIERTDILEVVAFQAEHPEATIITNQYRLLGWPHTIESYRQFAAEYGMTDRPLLLGYFDSQVPPVPLLNLTYTSSTSLSATVGFDTYLHCSSPVLNGEIEEDHPEVVLMRLWTTSYYWQPGCVLYQLGQEK